MPKQNQLITKAKKNRRLKEGTGSPTAIDLNKVYHGSRYVLFCGLKK